MGKRPIDIGGARRFSNIFINTSALENAMAKKTEVPEPTKELTIDEKLRVDYYKPKLPYASRTKDPIVNKAYCDEENRLYEEFKTDALREVGLEGHPKADKVFDFAWRKGHANGHHEVFCELSDIAELFTDD